MKTWIVTLVLLAAAILEVGGDALARTGLHSHRGLPVAAGFMLLGSYGIVVNQVPFDFSRMLGAYVGIFAAVSLLFGRFVFHEVVLPSTWIGVGIILAGSFVVQYGA
jgi:small multidrug resistance family-3 protein